MFDFFKRRAKKAADKSRPKLPILSQFQTKKRSPSDAGGMDWATLAPLSGVTDSNPANPGDGRHRHDGHHPSGDSVDPGTLASGHHHGSVDTGGGGGGSSHSHSCISHSGGSHSCSSHSCGGHSCGGH